MMRMNLVPGRDPIHPRHTHVHQEEVHVLGVAHRDGFFPVVAHERLPTVQLENVAQALDHVTIIVDDRHALTSDHAAPPTGRSRVNTAPPSGWFATNNSPLLA